MFGSTFEIAQRKSDVLSISTLFEIYRPDPSSFSSSCLPSIKKTASPCQRTGGVQWRGASSVDGVSLNHCWAFCGKWRTAAAVHYVPPQTWSRSPGNWCRTFFSASRFLGYVSAGKRRNNETIRYLKRNKMKRKKWQSYEREAKHEKQKWHRIVRASKQRHASQNSSHTHQIK